MNWPGELIVESFLPERVPNGPPANVNAQLRVKHERLRLLTVTVNEEEIILCWTMGIVSTPWSLSRDIESINSRSLSRSYGHNDKGSSASQAKAGEY